MYDIRFKNQAEYNLMLAGLRLLGRELAAGRIQDGDDLFDIIEEGANYRDTYGTGPSSFNQYRMVLADDAHDLADEINGALRNVEPAKRLSRDAARELIDNFKTALFELDDLEKAADDAGDAEAHEDATAEAQMTYFDCDAKLMAALTDEGPVAGV